jgi:hypothetical protein
MIMLHTSSALVMAEYDAYTRSVLNAHTHRRVYVEQLMCDYLIDLPIPYGLSRVMDRPHFINPAEREYISITLLTNEGIKRLTCTRRMLFDVVRTSIV